jgi:hypothetical protein
MSNVSAALRVTWPLYYLTMTLMTLLKLEKETLREEEQQRKTTGIMRTGLVFRNIRRQILGTRIFTLEKLNSL